MDPWKLTGDGVEFDALIGFAEEWRLLRQPFWVLAMRVDELDEKMDLAALRYCPSVTNDTTPAGNDWGPPRSKVSLHLTGVHINKMRGVLVFNPADALCQSEKLKTFHDAVQCIGVSEHVFVTGHRTKRDLLAVLNDPLGRRLGSFIHMIDDMLAVLETSWAMKGIQDCARYVGMDAPQCAEEDAAVMNELLKHLKSVAY